MADKTVRINVDGQEAQNFQSSMRQGAENLAREMIRSARSYSTSSKEVIKDIEEQIRAIEKRNRLDKEFQSTRLESLRSKGSISDVQYGRSRDQLMRESREDQIQTKLLREIIDTIKSTSKEEIREDRKNVYQRISTSKTVGKLGVSGDELAALKETLQQDLISDVNVSEQRQRKGFNIRNAAMYGRQAMSGDVGGAMMAGGGRMVAGAMSNPVTAIAALALIFGGFSFIQNKKIGERLKDYAITTGTPAEDLFGRSGVVANERGWAKLGMSPIEVLQMRGQMTRSYGGQMDSYTQDQLIGITRSRNVSQEQINRVIGLSRYGSIGESGGLLSTAALENYLKSTGQSLTRLPEVLDTFMNVSNTILQKTGQINEGDIIRTISGIGQSYGVSGVNLNRYANAFQGAFSRSQNPQMQALQFRVMSELNPSESLWQLQTRMRDPLSQPEYIRAMMNRVKGMYGGSEQGKFTMLSMFEQFGLTENDVNKMWKHDFNAFDFDSKKIGTTATGYKTDAEKFVSASMETSQKLLNAIELFGAQVGKLPEEIRSFFNSNEFGNTMSKSFADGVKNAKASDPTLFN